MYNQVLQTEDAMILTFAELNITAADYNGMDARSARAAMINLMGDRVNGTWNRHAATSIESLYDWPNAIVDFVKHTINVPPSSVGTWMLINS